MTQKPDHPSTSGQNTPAFNPKALAHLAAAFWVGAVVLYCLFLGSNTGLVTPLLVALAPLGPLYLAATAHETLSELRKEAQSLRNQLNALQPLSSQMPAETVAQVAAAPLLRFESAGKGTTASALAKPPPALPLRRADPSPKMAPQAVQQTAPQQGSLALDPTEPSLPPLATADLILALQFPESTEDHAGINALRLALQDRQIARLIRAAQDMLTLLSQEGVFMDHLSTPKADPALWRRFAKGERGAEFACLGDFDPPLALEVTSLRIHQDAVFRDAAHHFLRSYDKALQSLAQDGSDSELEALFQTRTARAFVLCAKALGVFDIPKGF